MGGRRFINLFTPPLVSALPPLVPLPGAAVDILFTTGQAYPTPLATLMNPGLTSAIGLLLTTLQGAEVSVLLQLKSGAVLANWVAFSGGSMTNVIFGASDTTARTHDNFAAPVNLIATAGVGGFSSVASKVCAMFGAAGRSIVMNNGVVNADANVQSAAPTACSFINMTAAAIRFTAFPSKLADATGKAFTV